MVKIVKNLNEATSLGLLNNQSNSQSDIGKIINDVKDIINGIKELKTPQATQSPSPQQPKQMDFNKDKTDIKKRIPVAVLKIDDKMLNDFIDNLKVELNKDNLKKMSVEDIINKWDILKEVIKPEIKTSIKKIAKAEIEFR